MKKKTRRVWSRERERKITTMSLAHAKAITGINFETSLQSGEACQSWNRSPFATFGGQITHWLFVQCTVFSRVFAALEWSFHLAWNQLSNLLKADTFTADAAKKMCHWKHWALMGYHWGRRPPTEARRDPWDPIGTPWVPMGYHGSPWGPTEPYIY